MLSRGGLTRLASRDPSDCERDRLMEDITQTAGD
jgi:hypothetical protein